jgi:hypothetical protein
MNTPRTTLALAIVSAMTILLSVHASARSADLAANVRTVSQALPGAPDRPPAGVLLNGFAVHGTFPRKTGSVPNESEIAPPVGAQLLLLDKDKLGGNVHLTWSGGAPPYVLQRWGNIIPSGTSTTLPSPPTATAYDDPVLFDGINECWLVN